AEIDEFVLHASGGHPGTAYGLYAGGQLGPSFALLVLAAGISLALGSDPPPAAGWLITVGVAGFLAGTRVVAAATARRFGRLFHVAGILGVVFLALLQQWITATGVLVGATAWTVAMAAVVSAQHPHLLRRLAAEPIRSGTRTHRI
ncbi:MAG TPA: hypothetical protein VFY17_00740, partial [Pilimelia sp.]|nr:hypothetical protein [Pilimelia sp.]